MLGGFIEPLKHDETARLCIKLHCREMLEPTGLWEEEIANGIKPMHAALVAVLCRRFASSAPTTKCTGWRSRSPGSACTCSSAAT
jgi:hypothetical protein